MTSPSPIKPEELARLVELLVERTGDSDDGGATLTSDEALRVVSALTALSGEPVAGQHLEPHEQEALADRIAANIGMRLVPDASPSPDRDEQEEAIRQRNNCVRGAFERLSKANEEIARLRVALERAEQAMTWANAQVSGRTRYKTAQQVVNCLERFEDELEAVRAVLSQREG